ncbi:ankyrin repeat and LEM domain-containing protein 2 [Oratosquilla oratoria]|uniref:ankyrin repeat and LEM domain-containing protein 2 n=1 Tax=Oratosquilla oratoria TaxID=337810 RepID=UPI003F770F12
MGLSGVNVNDVAQLSDSDLRGALEKFGETIGPITPSTRSLWEKRLLRKLQGKDVKSVLESEQQESPEQMTCSDVTVTQKTEIHVYYGIFPPPNVDITADCDYEPVLNDKTSCLKLMKKHKGSRFKAFQSYEDALHFAQTGPDIPASSASCDDPGKSCNGTGVIGEKSSPYRGPKSQDLVKLRKSIEKGDITYFSDCVKENPRYLVSSGDTPAILQEGSRYNALHVACRTNQAALCSKVLSTVGNPSFFQQLYPDDSLESSERRSNYLVDLYLNMPDKGLNETPLHFASKHGSLECVQALTLYPACDKHRRNKFDQTPLDIVCTRKSDSPSSVVEQIKCLLGDQCYVPLFRDDDLCLQPTIGQPWSPSLDDLRSPEPSPIDSACSPVRTISPLSPSMKVRGYAGPMSPVKAEVFHKRWRSSPAPSPGRNNKKSRLAALRLEDPDKGLEKVGRNLAVDMNVVWSEYWDFLGEFVNLSTPEGLMKLDNYLKENFLKLNRQRVLEQNQGLEACLESACESSTVDLCDSGSQNASSTAPNQGDGSNLSLGLDVTGSSQTSSSTISQLCHEMEALRLNMSLSPQPDHEERIVRTVTRNHLKFMKNMKERDKTETAVVEEEPDEMKSQVLYIMQSCKVCALRMADVLCSFVRDLQNASVVNLLVTKTLWSKLKPEIVCLKNVVSKCCTDYLNNELDMSFIHVLLATKTAGIIQEELSLADVNVLAETFRALINNSVNATFSSDEDDDSPRGLVAQSDVSEKSLKRKNVLQHYNCVIQCLEKSLNAAYNNCDSTVFEKSDVNPGHKESPALQLGQCHCSWTCELELVETDAAVRKEQLSNRKFNKAHSFLHETLFSDRKEPHVTKASVVENQKDVDIVKKLNFEDEPDNVMHVKFGVGGSDIMQTSQRKVMEKEKLSSLANCLSASEDISEGEELVTANDEEVADDDSFATAPSSVDEDMMTPEEGIQVYINGTTVSKVDQDVLTALEGCQVDEALYPNVATWLHLINSHSQEERESWASPYIQNRRRRLSAQTETAHRNILSTPGQQLDCSIGSVHHLTATRTLFRPLHELESSPILQ